MMEDPESASAHCTEHSARAGAAPCALLRGTGRSHVEEFMIGLES